MENIIQIKGKVRFPITLDPGVWIFDDRRVDLSTFFDQPEKSENHLERYTKEISKHWDREITEGAIVPPTLKTEKKFLKEQLLSGSFGIPLKPFLLNAEPHQDATSLIIETASDKIVVPLEKAFMSIVAFSENGKPLKQDGPVHIYFGDGSNRHNPIKCVKGFHIL
ncbi:MAG: peptidyl-prolyl cis-trans isomerase [Bacillota bacterium]|nr:peptidyl-prolyl cis-trans isomerase [Bacillota bacterium]MDP4169248.1 peptidyl-prolyl cis-trans isomerase [Bacillota bacterium]